MVERSTTEEANEANTTADKPMPLERAAKAAYAVFLAWEAIATALLFNGGLLWTTEEHAAYAIATARMGSWWQVAETLDMAADEAREAGQQQAVEGGYGPRRAA